MAIRDNLEKIRENVKNACQRSGRDEKDVLILAVTKTRSAEEINEAITLGITDIGENRVQELISKYDDVRKDVKWHIIGHLQTNKVKYIADKVSMIHSVDSAKLAKEINSKCEKLSKVMDILIEVNSGEENKSGICPEEIFSLIEEIKDMKNVRILGLMTMAPLGADEETLKKVFTDLKNLSQKVKEKNYEGVSMEHLSMGMSGDYEEAIECGATIIRPGRSLFMTEM